MTEAQAIIEVVKFVGGLSATGLLILALALVFTGRLYPKSTVDLLLGAKDKERDILEVRAKDNDERANRWEKLYLEREDRASSAIETLRVAVELLRRKEGP